MVSVEAKIDYKIVLKEMVRINVEEVNFKKVFEESIQFIYRKGSKYMNVYLLTFIFLHPIHLQKSLYKAGVQ